MQSNSDPRIIEPVELRVEGVSKSFGAFRALHDVNVTARLGQVTALVGPNGAGKTTLFHVIGGNLAPDAGRVFLNGAAKRNIRGEITQEEVVHLIEEYHSKGRETSRTRISSAP